MTLAVRHSTASGRLDECWDWVGREQRIDATVRMGARSVPLTIAVCSQERPRLGAHPIARIDGESWRIVPARYVRAWPNGVERLVSVSCPIGDVLAPGEQIVLRNTPPAVDAELEAL